MIWFWPTVSSYSYAKTSVTNSQVKRTISEIGSNSNSILRPDNSKCVIIKFKRKVENSLACTFEPLILSFYYIR